MRLLFSPTSPYVRKVRVAVIEKGLEARIELQPADVFGDEATVAPINPLRKVPALILDSGEALYDSPVICEYLDSLAPEPALLPPGGPARWSVLRTQALADGIADAGFNIVMERRRPEAQRSDEWQGRWRAAILRACAALDREAQGWDTAVDLGQIAAACALGYVDFRLAEIDWRAGKAPWRPGSRKFRRVRAWPARRRQPHRRKNFLLRPGARGRRGLLAFADSAVWSC